MALRSLSGPLALSSRLLRPSAEPHQAPLSLGAISPVRHYIRSFWPEKTAYPFPGHIHNHQKWFQHKHRLDMQIRDKRPSEIKRFKYYGYENKMKYATGRAMIMDKLLKGEKFLAEA